MHAVLARRMRRTHMNLSRRFKRRVAATNGAVNHGVHLEAVVAEYRALNQALWSRGVQTITFMSLAVTGSLILLTFVLSNLEELHDIRFLGLEVAGFIPILGLVPVLFAIVLEYSATRLDWFTLIRMAEIERSLRMRGHHSIYENVRSSLLYRLRQRAWRAFLWLLLIPNLWLAFWIWFGYSPGE